MTTTTTREVSDDERAYRRGVHQTFDRVQRWLDDGITLAEIRQRIAVAVVVAREIRHGAQADEAHPLLDQLDAWVREGKPADWAPWKPKHKFLAVGAGKAGAR